MMKYLINIPLSFARSVVYRSDIVMSLVGLMLRISIYYALWNAIGVVKDTDPIQLTTYSLLAVILARSTDSSISLYLGETVKDGSISMYLLRPVDLQLTMLFRSFGENLNNLVLIGVPLFLLSSLFFPILLPASLMSVVCFGLSIAMACLVGGTLNYVVGVATFWTYNSWGISIFKQLTINAFSGALIPILLFPPWLTIISGWLPFQYMVNQPILVYLARVTIHEFILGIAIQLAWAVGLFIVGRFISVVALSKLVIQGG